MSIGFPFSIRRTAILALLAGLVGCGEPLPPLKLMDADAFCGHLRQDDPVLFRQCVRDIGFDNELRIESRQRYLNNAASVDFDPVPMPAPFVPQPVGSMMGPTPLPASVAPTIGLDPYGYLRQPPPTVLCIGQVVIPGGSNAEGMRLGCQ